VSGSCAKHRPLLGRWVEGETSPSEALQLARHLPDCTACRIIVAREVRLARILDGLGDSIAVGEGFSRTVMRLLPQGPPPASRRARASLKLAGLGGALVLAGMGAWRLATCLLSGQAAPLCPRLELAHVEHLLATLGGVAGVVWALLDWVGPSAFLDVPVLRVDSRIALASLLPAAIVLLTGSTLAVVVARVRWSD